ncbi:hypothetical protein RFI_34419 [Reticulomyxa filosa]|uniref:Uncharacterized protein n=1 Tax=Reticulomyxa filosa TaxID=46433 RepID=X6LNQ0_RETFI|nr:hypothetical protein RFI_34419 [Reticulomyxa filosa]|eukprot:ETO02991.1 hypothetical protein RFI_34419 [Reticulomyxa filosa]
MSISFIAFGFDCPNDDLLTFVDIVSFGFGNVANDSFRCLSLLLVSLLFNRWTYFLFLLKASLHHGLFPLFTHDFTASSNDCELFFFLAEIVVILKFQKNKKGKGKNIATKHLTHKEYSAKITISYKVINKTALAHFVHSSLKPRKTKPKVKKIFRKSLVNEPLQKIFQDILENS